MPDLDPNEWLRALNQLVDLKVWGARIVLLGFGIAIVKFMIVPILEARRKK
jgi:hypothetical protein